MRQHTSCILCSFKDLLSTKSRGSNKVPRCCFDGDGVSERLTPLARFSCDSNSVVLQTSSSNDACTLSINILLATTWSTKTYLSLRARCSCCFAASTSIEHNWRSWFTLADNFWAKAHYTLILSTSHLNLLVTPKLVFN
jgi:hypothetical protein